MWPRFRSLKQPVILALCGTIGSTAMADPIEPHKVPTETIRTQAAGNPNPASASPIDDPAVHTFKVQPSSEGMSSAVSAPLGDDRDVGNGAFKPDAHAIRTIPIGPDTGTSFEVDRHFAPGTSAPSQPLSAK
jgi:hypothetical protein